MNSSSMILAFPSLNPTAKLPLLSESEVPSIISSHTPSFRAIPSQSIHPSATMSPSDSLTITPSYIYGQTFTPVVDSSAGPLQIPSSTSPILSIAPSLKPSLKVSVSPSIQHSEMPSCKPSLHASSAISFNPITAASTLPSQFSTQFPTFKSTVFQVQSFSPTVHSSIVCPTRLPTIQPSTRQSLSQSSTTPNGQDPIFPPTGTLRAI